MFDHLRRTTAALARSDFRCVEHVGHWRRIVRQLLPYRVKHGRDSQAEDVFLLLWKVLECLFRNAEVLGDDATRQMGQQLGDQQGLVLGEVSVVEDKDELRSLLKALDR